MNINLIEIKNQLNEGRQIVSTQVGKLRGHIIRVLGQCIDLIKKDPHCAIVTTVFANILFLEMAIKVATTFDLFFLYLWGEENWSSQSLEKKSVVLLSILASSMVGMNWALYRGFGLPLSKLNFVGVSFATCAAHVYLLSTFNRSKDI